MAAVETVCLQQPGQAGGMRLMAFGTSVLVFRVVPPAFHRLVHPIDSFKSRILLDTVLKIFARVTTQTKPGKPGFIFGYEVAGARGTHVARRALPSSRCHR